MPKTIVVTDAVMPTVATLKKYGLTEDDWRTILRAQGNVCGSCGTLPKTGRLNIDHAHVKGWKDMPPEERRMYVRGLVCYFDNRFILAARSSADRLQKAADYLRRAEGKLP